MIDQNKIKRPTKKELVTLRVFIIIGVLSIVNFFYWFLKPELIQGGILFCGLASLMIFDNLRLLYIWYHYWGIKIPVKPKSFKALSVDVLTTYFPGEPYDMIIQTLLAIKKISYPHTTYLCDEANDTFLKNFCNDHGIIHVTRNNRIDAKAGNINNALKQASGEICLILDPDHVPISNLLDEVIPYFSDDQIGFVQTVQGYYNVSESYVAQGAAEQTFLFYGPVMMGMNAYGTVNAIGANCVFRRAALDSIGGHAAGLSEDMHTAMRLYAKGWKSVYVPAVLTKGLIPATLTSYYKQQLKWSRGTLELLVTTFLQLFRKFSWRQKLHYGILPLGYLSGLFLLIGFLIPILSLFNATLPWKGNIINFGLIYLPVVISVLSIRMYSQKWVLNKSERGIHSIGGLLLISTWWVFLLGFVYTIFRKKIPYLPTPKEDHELTKFKILIPNILVAVISLVAVVYGLSIDFTPFTIFMAGFACLNAFFMFFTLVFAYQKPKTIKLNLEDTKIIYSKKINDAVFRFFNKISLPLVVIVSFLSVAMLYYGEHVKWRGVMPSPQNKTSINYVGVFYPKYDNGLTHLNELDQAGNSLNSKFDLISLYLAWDKDIEKSFPKGLVDSIYYRQALPVITWEPWLNTFREDLTKEDGHVYDYIYEGFFDNYLKDFANTLKALEKPVFLRFAHEFDNPFYPWHVKGKTGETKFKQAWIHVYEIFKNQNADNVIWIWNPWKAENIKSFYPGKAYVDWIGVNVLNYGALNRSGKNQSFKSIYKPFHDVLVKLPATPVMIPELGSLSNDATQNWVDEAIERIEFDFKEVKSIVYFYSKVDNNWPNEEKPNQYLDWIAASEQSTRSLFEQKKVPEYVFNSLNTHEEKESLNKQKKLHLKKVTGVNLNKGYDWKNDYHILNRKNLISDFEKMKALGVNTIKYQGNAVYDYNVMHIGKNYNYKIAYSFWINEDIKFIEDTLRTQEISDNILETIRKYKYENQILSWHIENDILYNQKDYFNKPEILYQSAAYINWLKALIINIKLIDSERPVVVDIEVNKETIHNLNKLRNQINTIDVFGLVVKNDGYFDMVSKYLDDNKINYIISSLSNDNLEKFKTLEKNYPVFIASWQDKHEINKLSFDGLIDRKGRLKSAYYAVYNQHVNQELAFNIPKINILKPAQLIYDDQYYTYTAMVFDNETGWKPASLSDKFHFEWTLLKCDEYGNEIALKELTKTSKLRLKVPKNHDSYKLQLSVISGDKVRQMRTELHTPLINMELAEHH
ncbi:glycosyltransferase family 2 protein [uncultured Algibacter sp.]|uniref:glycosyltransferase family 2 protein n=1 Tax=uncultured Algibacter sp. TaxID=298659 RepID=UPI002614377F|nr:glycosyltransferase family 2 protein [uncultured Algibacter sp.]